jgi:UDP-MurNAc hydroxylase
VTGSMKVTHIADSTFRFEHRDASGALTRVLTDPWIGTTIYGGAWMQYPAPTISADAVGPLDWVFISHIHEDHCDPATLRRLDHSAKVLLLDRRPNLVANFLRRNGIAFADVVSVPAYQPFELAPGLHAHLLEADPAHELNHLIDSALLITWQQDGGATNGALFCNDTSPHPAMIDYVGQFDIELALMPASGGSGYPACFTTLSDDEKIAERNRIVRSYFDGFVDAIEQVQPRRFTAIAGNHVVSGSNVVLNDHLTFLHDPAAAYRFAAHRLTPEAAERSVPLAIAEGDTVELSDGSTDLDHIAAWELAMVERSETDRKAFLADVAADARYAHDDLDPIDEATATTLFTSAAPKVIARMAASTWHTHVYVRLPGGILGHLDGIDRAWEIVAETNDPALLAQPHLIVTADDRLLGELLTGRFSWNIADAACFLRYERRPNSYDPEAVIALNHLTASAAEEIA